MKTKLVKKPTLRMYGFFLRLDEYLLLSEHVENIGGRKYNIRFMEDVFEAVCGAIKLDLGYDVVEEFIIGVMEQQIDFEELENVDDNYKDILLRRFQKNKWIHPTYTIIKIDGLPHNRTFTVGVDYVTVENGVVIKLKSKFFGTGTSRNKRGAEQQASAEALKFLDNNSKYEARLVEMLS